MYHEALHFFKCLSIYGSTKSASYEIWTLLHQSSFKWVWLVLWIQWFVSRKWNSDKISVTPRERISSHHFTFTSVWISSSLALSLSPFQHSTLQLDPHPSTLAIMNISPPNAEMWLISRQTLRDIIFDFLRYNFILILKIHLHLTTYSHHQQHLSCRCLDMIDLKAAFTWYSSQLSISQVHPRFTASSLFNHFHHQQ